KLENTKFFFLDFPLFRSDFRPWFGFGQEYSKIAHFAIFTKLNPLEQMGEGCGLVSIMDSWCLSYASVLEAKGCLTLLFKLREIGIFFWFFLFSIFRFSQ